MDTITFANGESYHCSFISTIPDGNTMTAFIALSEVTFSEAATIFSDQEMTSVMEYGSTRLVGYTTLQGLYVQPYGIQAVLKGGHDERRNQTNS